LNQVEQERERHIMQPY